jgi:hypothetical protein
MSLKGFVSIAGLKQFASDLAKAVPLLTTAVGPHPQIATVSKHSSAIRITFPLKIAEGFQDRSTKNLFPNV